MRSDDDLSGDGRIVRVEMEVIEPKGGTATSAAITGPFPFAELAPLFRGRSLVIELGVSSDLGLLDYATTFDRVRGVDSDSRALARLADRAAQDGITNAEGRHLDDPWDEPTGSADYVFALDLFRRVEDKIEAANYIQRISRALRRDGIAQLRFDSRPPALSHRLQKRLGGTPPVRRLETWVRDRIRGADMEILGERGSGTADHWVVARRR